MSNFLMSFSFLIIFVLFTIVSLVRCGKGLEYFGSKQHLIRQLFSRYLEIQKFFADPAILALNSDN